MIMDKKTGRKRGKKKKNTFAKSTLTSGVATTKSAESNFKR